MPTTSSHDFDIVLIRWVDSSSEVGTAWNDLKPTLKALNKGEYPHDMECQTAGFVMWENDQAVAVALSMAATECGPYILIPKVAVLEAQVLRNGNRTYEEIHV